MMRTEEWSGLASAPRWIITITGVYLLLGLVVIELWTIASRTLTVQTPSSASEALSVTAMAVTQLWLCLLVLRSFPPRAALFPAWLLIALSAAARVAAGVIGHLGGTASSQQTAAILSGPLQLTLLAAGLLLALRVLRKSGFASRPNIAGWALAGILVLFNLYRFATQLTPDNLLLCMLSVEAVFLWQSVREMGRGLVAKCWRALALGIFTMGFGQAALWVIGHYASAWLVAVLEWYVLFPSVAMFALAPAYNVAAVRRATAGPARASAIHPARGFVPPVPAN